MPPIREAHGPGSNSRLVTLRCSRLGSALVLTGLRWGGGGGRAGLLLLAQELGQVHTRHVEHLAHGRDGLHQAGDIPGGAGLAVLARAGVPDRNLVDLHVLDGVHLDAAADAPAILGWRSCPG